MELLQSIRYFFWGILKRFYYWLPFVVLDIPGLWRLYLEPFTRDRLGWELEMPDTFTTFLVIASLVWAGVLTYNELRQQKIKLEKQVDIREQNAVAMNCLTSLMQTGKEIRAKRVTNDDEFKEWEAGFDKWRAGAKSQIAQQLSIPTSTRFDTIVSGEWLMFERAYGGINGQHNQKLNTLAVLLTNLQSILDIYVEKSIS